MDNQQKRKAMEGKINHPQEGTGKQMKNGKDKIRNLEWEGLTYV